MMTYYGWVGMGGDLQHMASTICNCLGHGENNTAVDMLLETAAAETGLGSVPDPTQGAGMGLTQFDRLPFDDIKRRSMGQRDKILDELKIDISLVEWEHLRYNQFLSLLFTRLLYRLRPEPIPVSREGRAVYWKQFYNTEAGAGTVEHYMKMCARFLI